MLISLEKNIWIAEQPQKFLGLEMGARMTVVDVSGQGDLLVHSPIRPSRELLAGLKELGDVKYIIAPNLFHHLYVEEFGKKFPEAKLYCARSLPKKRRDLKFDEVIEGGAKYPWSDVLKHCCVLGAPICNEVVFFIPGTKTLLVTDLGLHICESSPFVTRMAFRLMGMFKKFGWSNLEKWFFVRNKDQFSSSIEEILNWDFEKIIMAHGELIESNGHAHFKRAFD